MVVKSRIPPEATWAQMIGALRQRLQLDQAAFGEKIDASAMAVSRWERGVQEPSARSYIQLGNLAANPDCWYFWGRAGLRNEDVMRVLPGLQQRLHPLTTKTADFEIVSAGSGSRSQRESGNKLQVVAIPLLNVVAATHGEVGDVAPILHSAPVEGVIAAPKDWCPNPAHTSCLRVRGHSMMPLIYNGYVIAADSAQSDRSQLGGKIVVAWNKDQGLTVSRFRRVDHTEILQSDNPGYEPIALNKANRWKVLAKVLWWIGKAP